MTRSRLGLVVCCLAFSPLTRPAAVRGEDPIDSVMLRDPELPTPKVVRTFSDKLPGLWLAALDRPEADYRCRAALAFAEAHRRGMTGLNVAVPALARELGRADQHPSVRAAAAAALVTLEAKDAAPALFELAAAGDVDLCEVVEPALAKWGYAPAREEWLARLGRPAAAPRAVILAARCLAAVREEKAIPKLRELALSAEAAPAVRLEAARALGAVRTTGGEADADRLAADASPRGTVGRLAGVWALRQHTGGEAVRRLQAFARDPEASVAAVAATRLVEIDPALVEPVLAAVLASSDANVRTSGVEVLTRRPSDEHVRLLGDRLSDAHPDVRARARGALRARAADFRAAVVREGDRALAVADWRGREQAAILFAQLDHKPAAGRLADALADARPEVAVAAAWALRVLAVPDTYPKALDHFRQNTRKPAPPEWRDGQLTQLAQLFGAARYRPADAALRAVVPSGVPAGIQTRAAACWALGLLHEGNPTPEVARALAGRVAAVRPLDVENELVRRMSAVALGRMKATAAVPTLREFYTSGKPSFDVVSNACGWAIEQTTGEKMPPPGVVTLPERSWFLYPLD